MTRVIETDIADDLLVGADAIAAFIGCNLRRVYWQCEHKRLPAFKLGHKWHMRKSAYRSLIERLESEVA